MARPRKFDPDEVREQAMRAFWEHGYRDTSIDDLVAATGVRPGSLYHAFPGGKRELLMESLARYSERVVPQRMLALERPGASIGDLRAYFDGLVEDLVGPAGRRGCLMVNTAMELAADDAEIAGVVRGHMMRLERNAARALGNARRRGEVPGDVSPAGRARQLMASAMGLMVVGRTRPGRGVLQAIADTAFSGLG